MCKAIRPNCKYMCVFVCVCACVWTCVNVCVCVYVCVGVCVHQFGPAMRQIRTLRRAFNGEGGCEWKCKSNVDCVLWCVVIRRATPLNAPSNVLISNNAFSFLRILFFRTGACSITLRNSTRLLKLWFLTPCFLLMSSCTWAQWRRLHRIDLLYQLFGSRASGTPVAHIFLHFGSACFPASLFIGLSPMGMRQFLMCSGVYS